ncbi:ferric transporter ATP-binding subunit [Actinobacillus equuli]|nr:ferric transporter ATP-binding subunit [Actinobacillus equuli]
MNKGKLCKSTGKRFVFTPEFFIPCEFMGESTIFDGRLNQGIVSIGDYRFPLHNAADFGIADGECLVGVRPEAIRLTAVGEACQRCQIKSAVYMGNHWEIVTEWNGKEVLVNANPDQFEPALREAFIHFTEQGIFYLKRISYRK